MNSAEIIERGRSVLPMERGAPGPRALRLGASLAHAVPRLARADGGVCVAGVGNGGGAGRTGGQIRMSGVSRRGQYDF